MRPNMDLEIAVLESILANAKDQHQLKAGLAQAVTLLRESTDYAEHRQRALREIYSAAIGEPGEFAERILKLAEAGIDAGPRELGKFPEIGTETKFSTHPVSGNAGAKSMPAETVRYDPAPECKGEIAARERLEPEGSGGAAGNADRHTESAQNGVTGRRDGHSISREYAVGHPQADALALLREWLDPPAFVDDPAEESAYMDGFTERVKAVLAQTIPSQVRAEKEADRG